jgi:protein-disulfide isomerase
MFKFILITLIAAAIAPAAAAQQPEVLATTSLRNFTVTDLSAEARAAWEQRDRSFANSREQLLSQMVTELLLEAEAKATGTTTAKLVNELKKKIADPSEDEIKRTYDANLKALENKPLNEVRNAIISFLRREPEDRALRSYVDGLAVKHKVSYQTDVNAAGLKPIDPLFTIDGRTVTDQEYENKYRLTLYEVKADLVDDVAGDLTAVIFSVLADAEAAALKIDQQTFIAREITDKMKQFTDDERAVLANSLRDRLFTKYKVKFLIRPPAPIVQKISVDDDPSRGPINAPVTVVMFADFQCPACSRTHPILQKVLAEFPGKVRFVARDFPLENIHENAFRSAVAAGAANAQGKFFEYGELLYKNQEALDDASLKKYAAQAGLNMRQFELDFSSEKTAAEVRKDMNDAESYGVTGTPTIFINGVMVRQLSEESFRNAIREALKTPGVSPARSVTSQ